MFSNASLKAFSHWYAEKGSQVYVIFRQSISMRFSSGEYVLKYLIINPFFFHRGRHSSNSSLVCTEALSMTTTVFFKRLAKFLKTRNNHSRMHRLFKDKRMQIILSVHEP